MMTPEEIKMYFYQELQARGISGGNSLKFAEALANTIYFALNYKKQEDDLKIEDWLLKL